ncbi:AMP-binding protein [Dermacoccaceae bacterium W4C1]
MSQRRPAGAGNRVVVPGDPGLDTTWERLGESAAGAVDPAPQAAAFLTATALEAAHAAWLAATDAGRETLIATRARVAADQQEQFRADGLAVVTRDAAGERHIEPADPGRPAEPGRIWLLTSGSTGRPKQVAHTLDSLSTVGGQQPARTWLCPYTPGAYAWWQVVTLSLNVPGQDIVFVGGDDDWPSIAVQAGVTAASGTPTFWRQALLRHGETLAQLQLEQVTLGGEPVDQGVLDLLAQAFPKARISWIYASSEAGAAIAVHDGRAGFPQEWLERDAPGRPRLSVDEGELVIASSKAAEAMDEQIRTGDRAVIADGRVQITGRIASDEINVGGSKASASAVRAALLAHPDVVWAAVRGRKAPLVGQMVAAEVVLRPDAQTAPAELTAWCADRLPEYSVPRRVRVLPEIPIKETLKSDV